MSSDMKWYLDRTTGPVKDFYDIFFQICRKYNISWGKATEKEKAFVEELTKATYELQLAKAGETPPEQEKTHVEFLATPQPKHSNVANRTGNSLQKLDAYVEEITSQRTDGCSSGTYWDTYMQILRKEAFRMGFVEALESHSFTSEACIQRIMDELSLSEEEARTTYERYRKP